jgi:hypothetical protein
MRAGRDDEGRRILPLLVGYWSFGQFWGAWVILVFEFQRHHDLTQGSLGLLYMALSVSAIAAMLVLAPRLRRLPLDLSTAVSLGSLGLGAIVLAFQPGSLLAIGFLLVGVGNGLIDVYLNVAAQREESRIGRPVLQWLHAAYALGGVTGALAAGFLRAIGVDYRFGIMGTGVLLLATGLVNARRGSAEPGGRAAGSSLSISVLRRHPALWVPALTVLAAFLVEGSMDVWSGLYLREQLGASAPEAAMAFAAFSGALFFGRLFASRVLFGLGPRRTILTAGIGAAIGGTVAISSTTLPVIAAAFLVMGFAISAAAPAGFGLVERTHADPSEAIAAVSTVGYTGFVWSPPLLGWIADTADLRAAMSMIVLATLGLIATGAAVREPASRPS